VTLQNHPPAPLEDKKPEPAPLKDLTPQLHWKWIALASVGIVLLFVSSILLWNRPRPNNQPITTLTTDILPPGDLHTPTPPPPATATFTPEPATATPTHTPLPTEPAIYHVQPGDTVSTIAEKFGVSMDELRTLNNLTNDVIYPDQELIIPGLAAFTPTPVLPATATNTPYPSTIITHTVARGDTLGGIALRYKVSVEAIQNANDISDETIFVGQVLQIPIPVTPSPTPKVSATPTPKTTVTPTPTPKITVTATPTATLAPSATVTLQAGPWQFSIMEGDLAAAYPQIEETSRFRLHYTPNTYPARDPQGLVARVDGALDHLETLLNKELPSTIDVYIAGTLFAPPNLALRGQSFSANRRCFFLEDGTGTAEDQQYITTHELTHLFAWNTLGRPTSALVSEGLAVYSGMGIVNDPAHLPLQEICTAYQRADQLPDVSRTLRFEGHIRDLPNYYAAGCFAQYLIDTYGIEKFKSLYNSGDYQGLYDRSLAALKEEWAAALAAAPDPTIDGTELLRQSQALAAAYDTLFTGFTGTPAQLERYHTLDKARLALAAGRLTEVDTLLKQLSAP